MSQTRLELHFEKNYIFCVENLLERGEKGCGEAGIWGLLQKSGKRMAAGLKEVVVGVERGGLIFRERQNMGIRTEIEAQRVKDHVISKRK